MSAHLQIGDIAHLLGITPKTIRHYHVLGLLAEPPRGDNGYRLYTIQDLRQLELVRRLSAIGLSLKQIKFIVESDEPDRLLRHVLGEHDTSGIEDRPTVAAAGVEAADREVLEHQRPC